MSGRSATRRPLLEAILAEALRAVDAGALVRRAVARDGDALRVARRRLPAGARLVVLAAGKAAAPMAAALEAVAGERIADGLVVTKDGHGLPLRRLALREAGHPVPDARSEAAGRAALALASRCRPGDVLLVLLSGGASALLSCAPRGLSLAAIAETTAQLLACGAAIDELNAVRKHLSPLAGGRLARRAGARQVEVLVLSDVPGDRLDVIASGPCAADPTRFEDALAVLRARGCLDRVPAQVRAHLEAGRRGWLEESVKPGHPCLRRVRTTLLGANRDALAAACRAAAARSLRALSLGPVLRGEARVTGQRLAALGRALRVDVPTCVVAGGETTVTLRGSGRGGRNQELALAAALWLADEPHVSLLAAGSDGSDGPTDAAGAYVDADTVVRGRRRGVDAREALEQNDSHGYFVREGGVLRLGPTRTNVMDLTLLLCEPQSRTRG